MIIFQDESTGTMGTYVPGAPYLELTTLDRWTSDLPGYAAYLINPEDRNDLNAVHRRFADLID